MYELNEKIRENVNNIFQEQLGMSYDEFSELDFDEQQNLLSNKRKANINDRIPIMIGSGEHVTFIYAKKGESVMLDDGTIIIAGTTIEEEQENLDKELSESFSNKVKKKIKLFKR